jgi:hypothetical protein
MLARDIGCSERARMAGEVLGLGGDCSALDTF